MADVTVTPANVEMTDDTVATTGIAGEALVQGQSAYLNSSGSRWYKSESDDTEAKAETRGIVMTPAATGAQVVIATGGTIKPGATLSANTVYVLSVNSGRFAPIADLATGNYVTLIGIGKSTTELSLLLDPQGYQSP